MIDRKYWIAVVFLLATAVFVSVFLVVQTAALEDARAEIEHLQQGIALMQDSWGSPQEVDQLQLELGVCLARAEDCELNLEVSRSVVTDWIRDYYNLRRHNLCLLDDKCRICVEEIDPTTMTWEEIDAAYDKCIEDSELPKTNQEIPSEWIR